MKSTATTALPGGAGVRVGEAVGLLVGVRVGPCVLVIVADGVAVRVLVTVDA